MQELDLRVILSQLLSKIKWLIFSALAGTLLLGVYAYAFVPEQYTSSILIYIRNLANDEEVHSATLSNLNASQLLTDTFSIAMKTDSVLGDVSAQLGGAMSAGELKSHLSAENVDETAFLRISLSHSDPQLAQRACNTLAEVSVSAFSEIGEVGSATVVGTATVPVKTSPNLKKYALLGFAVGLVLSAGIVILRMITDVTIRDKTSLQMHLDVPVLGEIPSFSIAAKGGKNRA